MKTISKAVLISMMCLFVMACGTTSGLRKEGVSSKAINLSGYDTVVILDFGDGTKNQNLPSFVGKNFADRIEAAVRATKAFDNVLREKTEETSIVLNGDITRYSEGNSALRMMIGFGAGSSYFDATVKLHDSENQDELAEIVVDKNSWVLGGAIASSQTVEEFMNQAAKKIASELAEAKDFKTASK